MASATPLESSHVAEDGTLTLHFVCPLCQQPSEVSGVNADRWSRWHRGEGYVQDMLPELSDGQRGTLMSGEHEACFDALFAGMDEDE